MALKGPPSKAGLTKLALMTERSNTPASWPRRALASLLDLAIAFLPAFIIFTAIRLLAGGYNPDQLRNADNYGDAGQSASDSLLLWSGMIGLLLFILFGALLASWAMARKGDKNGQTLGKQLLKIRAVRSDGADWDIPSALVREAIKKPILLYLPWAGLILLFPVIISLADMLSPLFDKPRRRAYHDRWAKSRVWCA